MLNEDQGEPFGLIIVIFAQSRQNLNNGQTTIVQNPMPLGSAIGYGSVL